MSTTPTTGRASGTERPAASSPPKAAAQVAAVLAVHLAALRGPHRRRALTGLALLPLGALGAAASGLALPRDRIDGVTLLIPSAWLLFAASTLLAATTEAGGRRLLAREQAVVFPVTPAADHLGALLLAPLSVAWSAQAVGLLTLTSWVLGPSSRLIAAHVLTGLWILCCTVVGLGVGWAVELTRLSPVGAWALRAVPVVVAVTAVTVGLTVGLEGQITTLLDGSPTSRYAVAALTGFAEPGRWLGAVLELVLITALAYVVGTRLLGLLQRRPQRRQGQVEAQQHRRRRDPSGPWAAMLRIDRAGVWRSAPLRRGLTVLALVPGGAAALTGLSWPLIALLPGMVASGAGLLYGVNAFALDSSGAAWRSSRPGTPRTRLLVRLQSVAEVCLAAALTAVVCAPWRAGRPSLAELVAVTAALVAGTSQVVSRCALWSVQWPYAAQLREARDQPAPPAAMAGYSARLAAVTTLTGLVFYGCARIDSVAASLGIAVGIVLLSVRRLIVVLKIWDDETSRARVLLTVGGASS